MTVGTTRSFIIGHGMLRPFKYSHPWVQGCEVLAGARDDRAIISLVTRLVP